MDTHDWWEHVHDVARAARMLPSQSHGYSPFLLVMKQPVEIPILGYTRVSALEEASGKVGD